MTISNVQHIVATPGIRSGKPRIDGTRITVADVAFWHLKWAMSPTEIAGDYDLSLASVHAALAYYFDHCDEIDKQTADAEAYADNLREMYPSKLQEKLKRLHLSE